MIVEGQVHGSVAQGLGAAVLEHAVYDRSGQLVTGSFMDYAMPHADDMPKLREALHQVPATTNPLGVKGAGEAGTTAAIAAVMNAVADAIPGRRGDEARHAGNGGEAVAGVPAGARAERFPRRLSRHGIRLVAAVPLPTDRGLQLHHAGNGPHAR